MRRLILSISLFGAVLFGGAFVASLLSPIMIERALRAIVRIELEKKMKQKLEGLSNSKIVVLAQKALGKNENQIEAERREISQGIPSKINAVIDAMLDPNCECRKRLTEYDKRAEDLHLQSLLQLRQNLTLLIESGYKSVSTSLMREFRIFTASNAVAFALLGLVTLARRAATLQLVLPAVVLVGATVLTNGLYLFGQNWLHTIIFGDYLGFAYSAYLGVSALFLADVLFNRARVSTNVVNAALNVIGSTVTAVTS